MTSTTDTSPQAEMPFLDHVRELRSRLYWCLFCLGIAFVVAFATFDSYITYLTDPFLRTLEELGHKPELRVGTIQEAFMTKVQFSFIAGLVLSFPLHLFHITGFVIPALTKKEKSILGWILFAGTGLFIAGMCMAYFVVLPLALQFLLNTDLMPVGVNPIIDYQKNLMFAAKMVLAFAVLFQLPLVLVVLMAFDIVKRATLLKFSRYFIVLIFVVSAIMTPPDIISQVALSLPLIVLYFLSIFVAKILGFGNPD